MTECGLAWVEGSDEVTRSSRGWLFRMRGHTVGMPAVLRVQLVRSRHTVHEELARLLRSYWRYGPLGRVMWVDPRSVDGRLFHRTMFETDNPRPATVLVAASEFGDSVYIVVRLLVAGFGRVEPHLEEVFAASIRKSLELVESGGGQKSRIVEE